MFKAGEFDFYVINIHSIYGDSVGERRDEARRLAEVHAMVQSQDAENDVILMGDFNLGPDDSGFQSLKAIPNMIHVNDDIPTSIKNRLYDNIWFQTNFYTEFTGTYGIIKFDEALFGNDDKKASLTISDHRPLWAEFEVSEDDDKGVLIFCYLYQTTHSLNTWVKPVTSKSEPTSPMRGTEVMNP